MSRVFSAIQPTGGGTPHIGNYLGALRGYVDLQHSHESFYCVADLHATTVPYDHRTLGSDSVTTAASMLACGIDPSRAVLFRQSRVPGHAALALLLGHLASLGALERMTQFKDKAQDAEGARRDSVGFGLLSYPVLMAADILLYHATLVPVGVDQHQHIQLCGTLARRFNSRFRTTLFTSPRRVHQVGAERIMSLRDPSRKMSKSDPNQSGVVYLTDDVDAAADKYRRATSDSGMLPSEAAGLVDKPAATNLVGILAAMTRRTPDEVCAELGGRGFDVLKEALSAAHEAIIVPIGDRIRDMASPEGTAFVRAVLDDGAERAGRVASATMLEVDRATGIDG